LNAFAWLVVGAVVAAASWRAHRALLDALRPAAPAPAPLDTYPSVSVIRPIKGWDPDIEENLRAGLDHGYPGAVETLFVFDDEDEPALAVVRRVVASRCGAGNREADDRESGDRERGGRDTLEVLFCGPPPPGRTGKLNAMVHGLRRARGDLVAFVDSDVRADRDALRVAVETLAADPKAGSASAPVVVSPEPHNLCDAGSAILLNALYGAEARRYARRHGGELPFILGQLMVLRREALRAIGDLEDVAGNFVDDIQIGAQVHRAGFRNRVTAHPVEIIWYGFGWREYVQNVVRWMTFSRGFPDLSFVAPIAVRASAFYVGLGAGAGLPVAGHGLASLPWWGAAGIVVWSLGRLHAAMGGAPLRPRHWAAPATVLLLVPFAFVRVFTQRRVRWRGREYALGPDGRLAERSDPPPHA